MKTYATYGLAGAAIGALMTLAMFFAGLHGERIDLFNSWKVQLPMGVLGVAIGVAVISLGIRAWREAAPDKAMSYGRGFGGGLMISLFNGLASMVFTILYGMVINPGFKDAMIASKLAEMQESGMPAEAYAMAEKMMNIMLSPVAQGASALFGTLFFGVIVSLIAAAILKRAAVAPVTDTVVPPAL